MAFVKTTILSTKQQAFGAFVAGQVVPVPTGRLDKVSLYLEPEVSDPVVAEEILVTVDVYDLDTYLIPTGGPLASDSRRLSEIIGGGLYNFRLESDLPTKVAVVLRCNGTSDNYVSWRYVQSQASSTEYMLSSSDGGLTWAQDPNKKFSYAAFSLLQNVVSLDSQTAAIRAGQSVALTDTTDADFSLAQFDRTKVDGTGEGATVVVGFGDFVITLVLDQSGSMTWNDHDGVRFDFLKAYIDDMEASLSVVPGSEASYSLVKFGSRKVGRMSLGLQSAESAAAAFSGVRIVRKVGSPVTGPADGLVIFEGIAEGILDGNLSTGTTYYYAAFSFDDAGNFSDPRSDFVVPLPAPRPPIGAAAFSAAEDVVSDFCVTLGDFADIGQRRVVLSWLDPANSDMLASYSGFYVTRRTDRFPETPEDGTPMVMGAPSILTPFYDTLVPAGSPALIPVVPAGSYVFSDFDPGLDATCNITYYYSLFTENSIGIRCLAENARQALVKISEVDRLWLKSEPPLDTPASYCFNAPTYDAPPSVPSVSVLEGNGELLLSWIPGPVGPPPPVARYELYYSPTKYPEGKVNDVGQLDFSGEKLVNSNATSFTHRGLDNKQPHFYALVAYDRASNQAAAVQAFGRPSSSATDVIQPADVGQFSASPVNATTAKIAWKNPFSEQLAMSAYFGDLIRATGIVEFSDLDPRGASAIFEIVEESREASPFGTTTAEAAAALAAAGLDFSKDSKRGASAISGTLSVPPSLLLRNQLRDVQARFYAALRVKDATGATIVEVRTPTATATLANPFDLAIRNEPAQTVLRRMYSFSCSADENPKVDVNSFPGVYVRTGEPFHAIIEASFRGAPIGTLGVKFRILDKATGEPALGIRLPGMDTSGTLSLQLDDQEDEELDRSNQPTGDVRTRTMISFDVPPQDVPGDYLLEATGSYLGYSRTQVVEMHFEPSLNIDVKARGFIPDGSDAAEQEALVYLGPPGGAPETKIPVTDLTVVEWSLRVIKAPRRRPLFSRDVVPGSGIKSYVRGGVAKGVFFGPGSEIEPSSEDSCTDGELYAIGAKASYLGMTTEAFDFFELLPFESGSMNRILLRAVPGQDGASGATSEFNKHVIYADGEMTSQWEVVAKPEDDGAPDDPSSGAYFRNGVTGLGGQVPSIEDGKVVTLFVSAIELSGSAKPQDILVKTNVVPLGQLGWAKARIEGGRALFTLSCNARIFGKVQKDETGRSNVLYGAGLEWIDSPAVFVLRASIIVEVNGRPVVFYGGGGDVDNDTPPAFLSLQEPLEPAN